MKTTIEISDPLLNQAKKMAARDGVTLRAVVERGLRRLLSEADAGENFKLRDASFGGEGLQSDLDGASWSELRDRAYQGRGA